MPELQPGMPAVTLAAALAEIAAVIGKEWVLRAEADGVDAYRDSYPVRDPDYFEPSAAVSPDGVEQIQAVVKIANRYKLPLWTVSTGRNLAYGGGAPRLPGSVVMDLSRMNRVIEVNEAAAYVVVEPSVTYFALYQLPHHVPA